MSYVSNQTKELLDKAVQNLKSRYEMIDAMSSPPPPPHNVTRTVTFPEYFGNQGGGVGGESCWGHANGESRNVSGIGQLPGAAHQNSAVQPSSLNVRTLRVVPKVEVRYADPSSSGAEFRGGQQQMGFPGKGGDPVSPPSTTFDASSYITTEKQYAALKQAVEQHQVQRAVETNVHPYYAIEEREEMRNNNAQHQKEVAAMGQPGSVAKEVKLPIYPHNVKEIAPHADVYSPARGVSPNDVARKMLVDQSMREHGYGVAPPDFVLHEGGTASSPARKAAAAMSPIDKPTGNEQRVADTSYTLPEALRSTKKPTGETEMTGNGRRTENNSKQNVQQQHPPERMSSQMQLLKEQRDPSSLPQPEPHPPTTRGEQVDTAAPTTRIGSFENKHTNDLDLSAEKRKASEEGGEVDLNKYAVTVPTQSSTVAGVMASRVAAHSRETLALSNDLRKITGTGGHSAPMGFQQREELFKVAEQAYRHIIGSKTNPSRNWSKYPNIVQRRSEDRTIEAAMGSVARQVQTFRRVRDELETREIEQKRKNYPQHLLMAPSSRTGRSGSEEGKRPASSRSRTVQGGRVATEREYRRAVKATAKKIERGKYPVSTSFIQSVEEPRLAHRLIKHNSAPKRSESAPNRR